MLRILLAYYINDGKNEIVFIKTHMNKGKRIHRNKSNIAFHMMQKPSVEGNFIIIHTSAINLVVDF